MFNNNLKMCGVHKFKYFWAWIIIQKAFFIVIRGFLTLVRRSKNNLVKFKLTSLLLIPIHGLAQWFNTSQTMHQTIEVLMTTMNDDIPQIPMHYLNKSVFFCGINERVYHFILVSLFFPFFISYNAPWVVLLRGHSKTT